MSSTFQPPITGHAVCQLGMSSVCQSPLVKHRTHGVGVVAHQWFSASGRNRSNGASKRRDELLSPLAAHRGRACNDTDKVAVQVYRLLRLD